MIKTIEQATAEIFLKPLIFTDEDNDFILNKQYRGIFYKDTNKPEWENKIILLFEYNGPLWKVDEFFNKSPYAYNNYIEKLNNKTYKIYAFTIPPTLKNDFLNLIKGNYEKIKSTTKKKIQQYWKTKFIVDKVEDYCSNNHIRYKTHYTFEKGAILNLNNVPI